MLLASVKHNHIRLKLEVHLWNILYSSKTEAKQNAASTLIYGVKQSRSGISSISSSDESIQNNEPPAKRRIPICMPHDSERKKDVKHMPEVMGDRSQRSEYRMPNCNALTTVRCSSCKIFSCFNGSRNCFKRFHET
ncbi:uncharacterized protein NPIL_136101 [Nephila pilipes]|uniref:Uncharacterized protein n=1 Tax=Nephila pilipes TaxID=299642 RepID=A0A8X6Q589_NEPPI|nr:uncharacterized protein NPIL_136101 [Nephila pilipes]